ncbi:hypothetical protein ACFV2S_04790 [Streptomyces sp. NPDC059695]|uniref:hypothetical protein n=1 Tax=Streptomyces sp. NPDC059695 TaxID=3346910 RepID=UPI0036876C74
MQLDRDTHDVFFGESPSADANSRVREIILSIAQQGDRGCALQGRERRRNVLDQGDRMTDLSSLVEGGCAGGELVRCSNIACPPLPVPRERGDRQRDTRYRSGLISRLRRGRLRVTRRSLTSKKPAVLAPKTFVLAPQGAAASAEDCLSGRVKVAKL